MKTKEIDFQLVGKERNLFLSKTDIEALTQLQQHLNDLNISELKTVLGDEGVIFIGVVLILLLSISWLFSSSVTPL